jgi:hypothetical protein
MPVLVEYTSEQACTARSIEKLPWRLCLEMGVFCAPTLQNQMPSEHGNIDQSLYPWLEAVVSQAHGRGTFFSVLIPHHQAACQELGRHRNIVISASADFWAWYIGSHLIRKDRSGRGTWHKMRPLREKAFISPGSHELPFFSCYIATNLFFPAFERGSHFQKARKRATTGKDMCQAVCVCGAASAHPADRKS